MSAALKNVQHQLTRRQAAMALLGVTLAGCGGGGGGSSSSSNGGPPPESASGTRTSRVISSRATGTDYALDIYLPPASAGPRSSLPVVYALDGESWFPTLAALGETLPGKFIAVAINTSGLRARDFVPTNTCTSGGGGNALYFDFIRRELIPYIETNIGGSPSRRVLFGHSHGGAFVLYAMFAEAPGQETFSAYLASDASISCMPTEAYGWEQAYAAAHKELPVRLHLSYASQGNYAANFDYSQLITRRAYTRLAYQPQLYTGSHSGIVPQVLSDAIPFAMSA